MKRILLGITIVLMFTCANAQTEVTLEQKRFSKHWFNSVEKALANIDSVYYLDLSLQKLKTFPKEIFKLKNLREVYLSYNYWENVPSEGWAVLDQVTILDLSGNYFLKRLPNDLGKMKSLKELDIKDNLLAKGEGDRMLRSLPNVKVMITVHKEETK